jgi:cleavage and polyadenylation specificity factor subunit 1
MVVITPFGLFEYLHMPFGLKNAAQSFQRLMDSVLQDLDFLFMHLDDILVASKNPKDHKQHLDNLFDRLQEHGLVIKLEKHQFGVTEINFLGHRVNTASNLSSVRSQQSRSSPDQPTSRLLNVS